MLTAGTEMTIKDGTLITANTTTSSYNAGTICIFGNGVLNMTGGTISGNTSLNGGGVTLASGISTFNMSGGTITGNTATANGGGVFSWGTFNMSGGTISGNTAKSNGDGVRIQANKFNMTGGSISAEGDALNVNKNCTVLISGGSVDGTLVNSGTITIPGGTFSDDPGPYVPADYQAVQSGDKWAVSAK